MSEISIQNPPSLRIFFATEMWERYGFYVVQSLLALYLALHFHWDDNHIYALVGSFTALTYLSPFIGGWVADQLLGQKRAIIVGALVLLLSYIILTLVTRDYAITLALAGIAVGTGLLKPNISSLLGNSYPDNATNRENGFTIFYMGITSGIILGTTLPSYLSDRFGWSTSFFSAAIGMIFSLGIFCYGIRRYRIEDYHPYEYQFKKILLAILTLALLWLTAFEVLHRPELADFVFEAIVFLSLAYILYCASYEPRAQAKQTLVIGLLCIISVMFWAFYFQMFLSLTLFIVRVVKPTIFGIPFHPPYYVAIQSIGMLIFGAFLTRRKGRPFDLMQQGISTGNKFVYSMVLTTAAYGLITIVSHSNPSSSTLISPFFIIPAYLLLSLAELFLSPVGLSAVTLLSSRKKVSTMMGIFFVSLGIGGYLSGKLATLTAIPLGETSSILLKAHYAASFSQLLVILSSATMICIVLNLIIKHLMTSISPIK